MDQDDHNPRVVAAVRAASPKIVLNVVVTWQAVFERRRKEANWKAVLRATVRRNERRTSLRRGTKKGFALAESMRVETPVRVD